MTEFCYSTEIPCPPGEKTNDAQGRCCVFPFTYGGKTFDSCTTYAYGNTLWCSFDAAYVGHWADCGKEKTGKGSHNFQNDQRFFCGGKKKRNTEEALIFHFLKAERLKALHRVDSFRIVLLFNYEAGYVSFLYIVVTNLRFR